MSPTTPKRTNPFRDLHCTDYTVSMDPEDNAKYSLIVDYFCERGSLLVDNLVNARGLRDTTVVVSSIDKRFDPNIKRFEQSMKSFYPNIQYYKNLSEADASLLSKQGYSILTLEKVNYHSPEDPPLRCIFEGADQVKSIEFTITLMAIDPSGHDFVRNSSNFTENISDYSLTK